MVYNATLNGQGYIATINEHGLIYNYSYDKNGYLSKVTWDDDSDTKCTWNNGDLIIEHYSEDSVDDKYEYTNYPAKQNIDIFGFVYGYSHVDDPELIGAVGLVGRKNAHLIALASLGDYGDMSFDYEFDDNGNPAKITEIFKNYYFGESQTTTYKILYK